VIKIFVGDCRSVLRSMPAESVHACITSPPFYGLREYGIEPSVWGGDPLCEHDFSKEMLDRSRRSPGTQNGSLTGDGRYQATACRFEIKSSFCVKCGSWCGVLGMEPDWRMYVEHLVEVFREVRRVLRPDGTLWCNLGDSYATGAGAVGEHPGGGEQGSRWAGRPAPGVTARAGHGVPKRAVRADANVAGKHAYAFRGAHGAHSATNTVDPKARGGIGPLTQPNRMPQHGMKPKDLMLMPSRVAIALVDDGWWLRSDICWSKGNPMPESVTDRPTKSWEHVFLLAKDEMYFYDADAIAEPVAQSTIERVSQPTLDEQFGSDRVPGKTNGPMKAVLKRSGNKERKPAARRGAPNSDPDDPNDGVAGSVPWEGTTRNKRDVWSINTHPFGGEFCRACQAYFEGETLAALRVEIVEKDDGRKERRRWCSCGAHDQWLSHFATFPSELVEAPVKAGTSERGCCAMCGAPFERVQERIGANGKTVKIAASARFAADEAGEPIMGNNAYTPDELTRGAFSASNGVVQKTTVGWQPTCRCATCTRDGKLGRAIVLDPFAGAGTTGLVADRLGRDAVLIEMNPEYVSMIEQRLKRDGGMFACVAVEAPAREAAE
jgi:DNA modification methylase